MPKATGRPTKYKPKVVRIICDAISDGVPYKLAALLGGISYETFCQWRRQFPEFSDAIDASLARGAQKRLQRIDRNGAKGDSKSDQWWLERVLSEYFSRSRATIPDEPPPTSCSIPVQAAGIPVTTEQELPMANIRKMLRRFLELEAEEERALAEKADQVEPPAT